MLITSLKKINKRVVCWKFSEGDLEGKKKINYEKASIKLMVQPPSIKFDINSLKTSKQYYIRTTCKIFFSKGSKVPISELATLSVDGQFAPIQLIGAYQKVMESVSQFWLEQNIDIHLLYIPEKLQIFLKFLPALQRNSKWNLGRYFLAFLAYYQENSKMLQQKQYEFILSFLCQRHYFTQNGLKYIGDNFTAIPIYKNTGKYSQAKIYFRILCNRIKILSVLTNQETDIIPIIKKKPIIDCDKLLKDYVNQWFKYCQNSELLQQILTIDPSLWVIDQIFNSQYRQKTIKMYDMCLFHSLIKLLEPTLLYRINYHSDLFLVLFDKLFIFCDLQESDEICQILLKFKQYLSVSAGGRTIVLGPSLLLLCQKYTFTSRTIAEYYYQNNIKDKLIGKNILHPTNLKKNIIYNKNLQMQACLCLAICEEVSGQINPTWRSFFVEKLSNILEFNLYQFPGIYSYAFLTNIEKIRNKTLNNDIIKSFYKMTGQFSYEQSTQLNKKLNQIQNSLGANFDSEKIEQFSYPINTKINDAARLNVLIWNLYYYAQFVPEKQKIYPIYESINSNAELIDKIQANIAYPQLLQGLMKFIQKAWGHKNFNSSPANQLSRMIKQQKLRFNTIFADQIQDLIVENDQNKINKNKMQSVFYKAGIEHFSIPIHKKLYNYSTNQQIKLNLLDRYGQLFMQTDSQQKKIRKVIMEEMRNFFTKNPRNLNKLKVINNHLDFPYFADFLIMFRGKAVTVFVTGQNNQDSNQDSIQHFKKNSSTIIIKTQQDIKKIFKALTSSDFYS